jgi:hypothetical protein
LTASNLNFRGQEVEIVCRSGIDAGDAGMVMLYGADFIALASRPVPLEAMVILRYLTFSVSENRQRAD